METYFDYLTEELNILLAYYNNDNIINYAKFLKIYNHILYSKNSLE